MLWRGAWVAVPVLFAAQMAGGGERLNDGDRIRVKATSEVRNDGTVIPREGKHWIVGKLLATDADYLNVMVERGQVAMRVPRTAVERLEASRGRSRGKAALIGAGIGAVVGLGWGAIEHSRCESRGEWLCDLAYGIPVLTAPAGAIVGLAIGKERWTPVSPTTLDLGLVPVRGGIRVVGVVRF